MTVSSANRKAGPYTGDGRTAAFPFGFKVFSAADVLVVFTDLLGAETTLALGAGYSISLNADQNDTPGGTLTLPAPLVTGCLLTLTSNIQNLQTASLTNQGGFYPAVIETALDRLTIMVQQVAEQAGRAFKIPISSVQAAIDSVQQYLNTAANSANQAAASQAGAAGSAALAAASQAGAAGSASQAATSALAAAVSASTAAAPAASVMVALLDAFFPVSQLVNFAAMYVAGGWDLGTVTGSTSFPNEVTARRASLAGGTGATFDFGTVP